MASPALRSQIITRGTTGTTTPVVNLPATIAAGDTILVVFRCASTGVIGWPAGWQEMEDNATDASDDQTAIAWKKAVGGEGGTTITLSSASGRFSAVAYAVSGATDPSIRAPEISTIATGIVGAEPNATTVTPTGGSKDYLFLTVYAMEGEQTGVTAYPTNYTLGQLWADCGTAGAVGLNCTVGAAARQATAASEDAGVWDVAGTIDDWSAYTLAFHPAEAVTAPLHTSGFEGVLPPARKSLAIAGLTIALSLLQTTLGVSVANASTDVYPSRSHTTIQAAARVLPPVAGPNLLLTTLGTASNNSTDVYLTRSHTALRGVVPLLPPVGGANSLLTSLSVTPDPPVRPVPWPLPSPLPRRLSAVVRTTFQAEPAVEPVATPVPPVGWPLPSGRPALRGLYAIISMLVDVIDDGAANDSTDVYSSRQTTPLRGRPHVLPPVGQPRAPVLDLVVAAPVRPLAWSLPVANVAPAVGWTQPRPVLLAVEPLALTPDFGKVDWPLPAPARVLPHTWTQRLAIPAPGALPAGQAAEWPVPPRAERLTLTWSHARPLMLVEPLAQTPDFAKVEWPLPAQPKPAPHFWSQRLAIPAPGALPPGHAAEWPVPSAAERLPLTWTQSRPTYYVDARPAALADWPNPRRAGVSVLSWTCTLLQTTLAPLPPGRQTDWAIVRPVTVALERRTHLQARPSYYLEVKPPFVQGDWPNPRVPARALGILDWSSVRPLVLPVGAPVIPDVIIDVRPTDQIIDVRASAGIIEVI